MRSDSFGWFVVVVLGCALILFALLLGIYEVTKDYTIVGPATNAVGSDLCMVFEEGELVSYTSTGKYGDKNTYICYNPSTEQYSFCEPTFVECK